MSDRNSGRRRPRTAVRRISRAAAVLALILLCLSPDVAAPGHFEIEASLEDGRDARGIIGGEHFEFEALIPGGATVRIDIASPPQWSSTRTALEISRTPEERFLLRALDWTAEVGLIKIALPLRTAGGESILATGSELREARFIWSP